MVTIVAWNLNHWRRAHSAVDIAATWTYLRDELGADVALVSEAAPPVGREPVEVIGTSETGRPAVGAPASSTSPGPSNSPK